MLHLRHWGTPPAAICKSKIGKLWPAQLAPPPDAPPPPSGSSFLPAVSIVIQLLALSTRLLRRLLLRFFLPLILQFGLIPFLRFLHFAAAGAVSGVLRVTGARRQSCASLGHAASRFPLRVATSSGFTERLPTPPSPSSRHRLPMMDPRLLDSRRIRSSQDLRKGVSMTSSDGSLRRRSHRAPSKPSSTR